MTQKRNLWIRIAALAFLAAFSVMAQAESGLWIRPAAGLVPSVSFAWDYNSSLEPTVVGFWIYQGGVPGNYTNRVYYPGTATRTGTVTNVPPGRTYYFAVTAYTSDGLESDFSTELKYRKPGAPAVLASSVHGGFVNISGQGEPFTEYAIERSSDLRRFYLHAETQANLRGEFGILELPELLPNPSFYRAYVAK